MTIWRDPNLFQGKTQTTGALLRAYLCNYLSFKDLFYKNHAIFKPHKV